MAAAFAYVVISRRKNERRPRRKQSLKNCALAPPIRKELASEAITKWRQAYRRFRIGASNGSTGEGSKRIHIRKRFTKSVIHLADNREDTAERTTSFNTAASAGSLGTLGTGGSVASGLVGSNDCTKSIFSIVPTPTGNSDAAENAVEKAQNVITEWRLAYRRHRMGAPVGAKGELGDLVAAMSRESLRLLPAAQVATLRRAQSSTIARNNSESNAALAGRFHVHFGAGKLGLGLIIPSIGASEVPYAIIQRPSGAFKPILGDSGERKVKLMESGSASEQLLLFATTLEDIPTSWRQWLESMDRSERTAPVAPPSCPADILDGSIPRGIFVCTDAESSLSSLLVKAATSFSCSLGPGVGGLKAMLTEERLPKRQNMLGKARPAPALFAGENDHKAVDDLAEALAGRCDVVSCMVDRICTERRIFEDGNEGGLRTVAVEAEPYSGAIVVLTPPPHIKAPPFAGDHVLVPRVSVEADYLCRRKLLMVNGMHTTIAFLTLSSLVPMGTHVPLENDKLQPPFCDLPLVTLRTSTHSEQREMIRAWTVARILLLLFEWDLEVIKSAHGCVEDEEVVDIMIKYAFDTVDRFSTADDTTGRVLGGGVAARYNGRLVPVKTFLDDTTAKAKDRRSEAIVRFDSPQRPSAGAHSCSPQPRRGKRTVASMVLKKTDMDLTTIMKMVDRLTTAAQRFTGLDAPEEHDGIGHH